MFSDSLINNVHSLTKVSMAIDTSRTDVKIKDTEDEVLRKRLELMYTMIDLPYHPILKSFISKYIDSKTEMNTLLARAIYYIPIFEKELLAQNMPLELKLLPIVESSLIPNATSYMGAGGLWQFMPATAKMYDLRITSLVDERFDPVKSTRAACKYLKSLHSIYNNWTLAIAAYNCGPGNVSKAMARAKNSKTYWDIYPYLPHQTRDYVPAFIAVNYAFTFYKNHNVTFDNVPNIIATDTINVVGRVMDLRQISSTLGISEKMIKALNPQYKQWIVPAIAHPYTINIPKENVLDYAMKEEEILAKESIYLPKKLTAKDIEKLEYIKKHKYYVVKNGDYLGKIASRNRTTVKKLMKLNKLKNVNALKVGQKIKIS